MASKTHCLNNFILKITSLIVTTLWVVTAIFIVALEILELQPSYASIFICLLINTAVITTFGVILWSLFKKYHITAQDTTKEEPLKIKRKNDELADLHPEDSTPIAQSNSDDADIQQEKDALLSKQILANNLNHEIKTPIGIIQGYIDTLIEHDDMISKEMRVRFLKKCLENTQRLQNMAYNLSVILRIENGKDAIQMDEVDLTESVNSVAEDLAPLFEKNGITFVNLLPSEHKIISNTTVLYNLFSNLSKNAAFYSGGDTITVELLEDGNISFRDNGCGVDEEHLPKLFDRFYRIEKDRNYNISSSGLGLAIVKDSVKLHHGDIKAVNHPDGGLQFIFSLSQSN